jgi:3-dehydroquinate synthase
MIIHSRFKDYTVQFHDDLLFVHDFGEQPNTFYVVDRKVYDLYYNQLFSGLSNDKLLLIDASEENKVLDSAMAICERMTEIPAKRNALLISFGGGIIQDITGFAANILYRGINWIYIPTTLLAACDSCIGGKTSLNYKQYKNLLGTFYPPDVIHICPVFFQTLSERDYKSGMGEVVKFNVMQGIEGLENIENNMDALLVRKEDILKRFTLSSLTYKKAFIEEDEFDKGERIKLNFAHTFGHAIETISSYDIPHGTAVAIGTIMANTISLCRGILSAAIAERITNVLLKIIDIDIDESIFESDRYIKAMRKDKKQTGDQLTAILLDNKGELQIFRDICKEEVELAIRNFLMRRNKYIAKERGVML